MGQGNMAATGNQVYWIGQNGRVYLKGNAGVQDLGRGANFSDTGFSALDANNGGGMDVQAKRIADPVVAARQGTATDQVRSPSAAGGGGAAAAKAPVLNQAAVDATGQAISSLDTEAGVGNKNIDDSYASLVQRYDRDAAKNEADYTEQDITNNQNFQKNKQNALVAGAQGRRGLRSTLSALGALSGDGGKLADRAVTQAANEDIGGAVDTAATNSAALGKAIGNFRDEDRDRRAEAETTRTNQKTALEGSILSKRQQMFQKMAELFGEGGNTGEASNWLGKAGSLNNDIARKGAVAATPFAERSAAFTPGKLADYLAGAGDMTVEVAGGDQGGLPGQTSSIIAGRRKKEELQTA